MAQRSYNQYCGLAQALDILGERWTLLVVRNLFVGPHRYKDLLDGLPGIGTNLLAARLKVLEREGIVRRRTLPPPAGSSVYELTDLGRELGPALLCLAQWGLRWLGRPKPGQVFRPAWGVLALIATFRRDAANDVRETYEFHIEREIFHVRIRDGEMQAEQGSAPQADLVIACDAESFVAVASRSVSPRGAVEQGRMQVKGDPAALDRCFEMFGLPATSG